MEKESDYIEYFIANEKKQKRLTIIVAVLFSLLSFAIIALSIDNIRKAKNLTITKAQRDSLNGIVHMQDSIIQLKNRESKLRQDSSTVARILSTAIIPSLKNNLSSKQPFTIYIQYMHAYKSIIDSLSAHLSKKHYIVPQAEEIENQTFNPSIRYFDSAAKDEANRVAIISEQLSGLKFDIQYVNIKVSKRQIEIWVGNNRRSY
jgi:hypothetical protein